jgi:hypothetical protein
MTGMRFCQGKGCDHLAAPGKKTCREHLAKARSGWARRVGERVAMGACISCLRPPVEGELRCALHKSRNRVKSLRWNISHPEHTAVNWEKQKVLRDAGVCPSCAEHRPLPTGFRRCDPCRARRRAREAGGAAPGADGP